MDNVEVKMGGIARSFQCDGVYNAGQSAAARVVWQERK